MFIVEVFSYVFYFTSFTVVLDASSAYGEAVTVCVFLKHQSSSLQTRFLLDSSSHLRPRWQHQLLMFRKDLDYRFWGSFKTFCHVWVPCEILDLVDNLQSQLWVVC